MRSLLVAVTPGVPSLERAVHVVASQREIAVENQVLGEMTGCLFELAFFLAGHSQMIVFSFS